LSKNSLELSLLRLSLVKKWSSLPLRPDEQAIFVMDSPALVISDSLENQNFAADGALINSIETRLLNFRSNFLNLVQQVNKFFLNPIP